MHTEFEWYYRQAIRKAMELAVPGGPKEEDYNRGGVEITTYSMFDGEKHWWTRLWDKTLRLRSILFGGGQPRNEPLEDSCLDIINYAAFLYAEKKLREVKKEEQ